MADFNPDEFLAKTAPATESKPASTEDFNPDEYLARTSPTAQPAAAEANTQVPAGAAMAPAPEGAMPQFVVPGPSGINYRAVGEVLNPMVQAGKDLYQTYKTAGPAIVDVGAMALGSPVPPYATVEAVKGAGNVVKGAAEGFNTASKLASQFAEVADTQKYFDLWNKLKEVDPGIEKKVSQLYKSSGGGNAVRNWLTTSAEGQAFLANPQTARVAESYLGALPSKMEQAAKIAGPALRGAAKVLGPLGTAYNVYEAGQFAQESELGQRLAEGEGQYAPRAYRDLTLNRNVSQYQPSPQEAANLLASGDPRTVQMYGGAQALAQRAGQMPAQPAQPSWIDNAMQTFKRYRQVIGQ